MDRGVPLLATSLSFLVIGLLISSFLDERTSGELVPDALLRTEVCFRGQRSEVRGQTGLLTSDFCHLISGLRAADVGVEPGVGTEDAGQEWHEE
jgi:hypothetical protein